MSKLHLVTVLAGLPSKALYKNGQIVLTSNYAEGISNSAIDDLAESLSAIDGEPCQFVDIEMTKLNWAWEDVTIELLEAGRLGDFDMEPFHQWKALFLENKTNTPYPVWFKEWKIKQQQESEAREINHAMSKVFSKEVLDRLENEEDPDAYDVTICLSAEQRLTYFADLTVPGNCTEEDLERVASELNIDGSLYEIDHEYWEEKTPVVMY